LDDYYYSLWYSDSTGYWYSTYYSDYYGSYSDYTGFWSYWYSGETYYDYYDSTGYWSYSYWAEDYTWGESYDSNGSWSYWDQDESQFCSGDDWNAYCQYTYYYADGSYHGYDTEGYEWTLTTEGDYYYIIEGSQEQYFDDGQTGNSYYYDGETWFQWDWSTWTYQQYFGDFSETWEDADCDNPYGPAETPL